MAALQVVLFLICSSFASAVFAATNDTSPNFNRTIFPETLYSELRRLPINMKAPRLKMGEDQVYGTLMHTNFQGESLTTATVTWPSTSIIGISDDYKDFAELCFKEFGDRVKHWATLNEPYIFSSGGYDGGLTGNAAPGRCSNRSICAQGDSATEPYIVGHHLLLAHATAVKLYRDKYQATQKGDIGIVLISHWFVPYSSSRLDVRAAERALDFMYGWFINPIVYGDYPRTMRSIVGDRLPKFTKEEEALTAVSYFDDYPKGLHDLLVYTKERYNNPAIYITETGMTDGNNETKYAIDDVGRVSFYNGHIRAVHRAYEQGVNVKGFFAWSLLDNFEWGSGYTQRFGICYIDYKNKLTRTFWFKDFLNA
ncbi:Beta-glucosidase 24 [Sesamum angolense]|uniref:Beta-glucosidase 24 n=1 Tax=Sesamum angolense TaxID=2727404 RepID=A0AAE2BTU1_9LAMI|nr:Beta-glucosidase 24 [Sesamum angolense]